MTDKLKAQLDQLDATAKQEVIAYLGGAQPDSGGGPTTPPTGGLGGHN